MRELATDLLAALDGRRCGHLWIERQAPFAGGTRRIGATSAFNLGQRYMAIQAIAACHGWPYEIVSAAKWKRHFGIAATKSLALHMAGKLMPEDAGLWTARRGYCTRARGIGRAEAALSGFTAFARSTPSRRGPRHERAHHPPVVLIGVLDDPHGDRPTGLLVVGDDLRRHGGKVRACR